MPGQTDTVMDDTRPAWFVRLLQRDVLRRDDALDALAGEREDEPMPEFWSIDRQEIAERIELASRTKKLTLTYTSAATADDRFGNYSIARDELLRWAIPQLQRFPHTLIRPSDLPADVAPEAAMEPPPERAQRLWAIARTNPDKSQKELTALYQQEFGVDERTAQAWAAAFRRDAAVATDARAGRRRR